MPRAPVEWNWKGEDITKPLTSAETPAAQLSLLRSAEAFTVNAAITPYCGCARSFDGVGKNLVGGGFSGPGERYIGQMVAPGAFRARAFIARQAENSFINTPHWGGLSIGYPNQSWTTYGGKTGANIVLTKADSDFASAEFSKTWDRNYSFTSVGEVKGWVLTSDTDDDSPGATMDRMYEMEPLRHPKVEPMFITCAVGFSVCIVQRVGDLETLYTP